MKQKTYYISGMHCASCELLIEQRLLKEKGVRAADASLGNETLAITYKGQSPNVQDMNRWFAEDGYTFSETKKETQKESMVSFNEKQGVVIDFTVLNRKMKTLASVAVVFFILYLIEQSGISRYVTVSDGSSLGVFFLFGIVAGLSSCAALIGGLLLSLTKSWNEENGYDAPMNVRMRPHLYFHAGRILAYGALGGLLGAVGKAIAFENVTVYAFITLLVSLVMLVIGLQMAGVRWAERFQIRMPKFVTRNIAGAGVYAQKHVPFGIGAGTVLLPCGFTLIAQGIALTSGSAVRGALLMMLFVLGTMLPLLFIGYMSAKGSKNPKRARAFSFYAGVVLVMFALYNVNGQLNVLGLPSVSDVRAKAPEAMPSLAFAPVNEQGEQVVTMTARGFRYTLTGAGALRAGTPATLVVDNQGIQGCGAYLAARGLISGFVELRPGENIIDLGTPQPGTYKVTCSMGMVPPVAIVVQ